MNGRGSRVAGRRSWVGAALAVVLACARQADSGSSQTTRADTGAPSAHATKDLQAATSPGRRTILFIGTSLTAGYGLDPDSAMLSAKQVRALEAGETLPDGDVGLELTRQYYLRVISARDGSPAAKAKRRAVGSVPALSGAARAVAMARLAAHLRAAAPTALCSLPVA